MVIDYSEELYKNIQDLIVKNGHDKSNVSLSRNKADDTIKFFNKVALRIKFTKKGKFFYIPKKFIQHMQGIPSDNFSKEIGFSFISMDSFDQQFYELILFIYKTIYESLVVEEFSCCSRYLECSDHKMCVNQNVDTYKRKISNGCHYKKTSGKRSYFLRSVFMPKAKKLPSGNWRCQVYAGTDETGKRIMKSFTAATKKQAEYEASLWQVERKEKLSDNQTLGQIIENYITNRQKALSPSTMRSYKIMQRNYLLNLQRLPISSITHDMVQKAFDDLNGEISPKYLRNIYGLFYTATKTKTNVFENIKLPQKEQPKISIPKDAEIQTLLKNTSGEIKLAIVLAAFAGLRRSEIKALTWDKIDLENKRIFINQALVRGSDNSLILKKTKSTAGTRTVPICDILLKELQQQPRIDNRLIHMNENSITRSFQNACEKFAIPKYRLHDLRHYYASTLLALNIPDKYAMKLMGHATNNTLKYVYQHVKEEQETTFEQSLIAYLNKNFTE